jgi:hypothetical protein
LACQTARVDLVVGNQLAVEIKATKQVGPKHLKGLLALKEEGLVKDHVVVSLDPVWSLGRWRLGSGPAAQLGAPSVWGRSHSLFYCIIMHYIVILMHYV